MQEYVYTIGQGMNRPDDVWTTFEQAERALLGMIRQEASTRGLGGFMFEIWKVLPDSPYAERARFSYSGSGRQKDGVLFLRITRKKRTEHCAFVKPYADEPPNCRWVERIVLNPTPGKAHAVAAPQE